MYQGGVRGSTGLENIPKKTLLLLLPKLTIVGSSIMCYKSVHFIHKVYSTDIIQQFLYQTLFHKKLYWYNVTIYPAKWCSWRMFTSKGVDHISSANTVLSLSILYTSRKHLFLILCWWKNLEIILLYSFLVLSTILAGK